MSEMTPREFSERVERMTPLFIQKAKFHPADPWSQEWWEGIVATLIVDAWLCLTKDGFLDVWELTQEERDEG